MEGVSRICQRQTTSDLSRPWNSNASKAAHSRSSLSTSITRGTSISQLISWTKQASNCLPTPLASPLIAHEYRAVHRQRQQLHPTEDGVTVRSVETKNAH